MPENCFSKKKEIISKSEDLFGEVIRLRISSIVGGGKNKILLHSQLKKLDGKD